MQTLSKQVSENGRPTGTDKTRSISKMKSRADFGGGYRHRTLQRVSLAKWEQDADLEQGEHADKEHSVSLLLTFALVSAIVCLTLCAIAVG